MAQLTAAAHKSAAPLKKTLRSCSHFALACTRTPEHQRQITHFLKATDILSCITAHLCWHR